MKNDGLSSRYGSYFDTPNATEQKVMVSDRQDEVTTDEDKGGDSNMISARNYLPMSDLARDLHIISRQSLTSRDELAKESTPALLQRLREQAPIETFSFKNKENSSLKKKQVPKAAEVSEISRLLHYYRKQQDP